VRKFFLAIPLLRARSKVTENCRKGIILYAYPNDKVGNGIEKYCFYQWGKTWQEKLYRKSGNVE